MTITIEANAEYVIRNAWSGAKDRIESLSYSDIETILETLEECCPDGMTETELNDFFWFDDDTYAEWLGYEDAEALWTAKEKENT